MTSDSYDVIIVGGGPAGLSAALMLGRCRRRVLVLDAGPKRNDAVDRIWGFLSRDGESPQELLRIAREQLAAYPNVELRLGPEAEAVDVHNEKEGFTLSLKGGAHINARKLLLATGVVDDVPSIEGIEPLYGKSVHHCPYCHAWEVRDSPIAVYGRGHQGADLALEMTLWSPGQITLCTDGPAERKSHEAERLRIHGIPVREESIRQLIGTPEGELRYVEFTSGAPLEVEALFFTTGWRQRSELAIRLGCPVNEKGSYDTGPYEQTCIPGVYVVGDASPRVHFAIVAAGEGAQAAFAINTDLLKEDLARVEGKPATRRAVE